MPKQHDRPHEREEAPPRAKGPDRSDDMTQADAGMPGGTGAVAEKATAQPDGTEPSDEDERSGHEEDDT